MATPTANPSVEVVRRVALAVANRVWGTSLRPSEAKVAKEQATPTPSISRAGSTVTT